MNERPKGAFILLDPSDNILVCIRTAAAGDSVEIDGTLFALDRAIDVGHKIARCQLNPGDKVLRYAAPIGSMTRAAAAAEHVHSHNLKSDYIAAHDRTGKIGEQQS